jgi:2-methylcitrate dehydratase PrpD
MSRTEHGAGSDVGTAVAGLTEFVSELEYDDLPDEVVERQKWHLLDTLGCVLYGSTTPWVRKVAQALDNMGETGEASLLGMDTTASPARAALIHGTASHSMDYDDHCQDAGVHAGSGVVPALLSFSETSDRTVSGEEALASLVAGVETGVRAGRGIGMDSVFQGWHIAGWTDSLAAAATAGKLAGLDTDQLGHALGIAGTQGSGLMGAVYGAEVKRYHMGRAAESGYLAVALAREGLTGDRGIFEDRWGSVTTALSDDHDASKVTDGIGERFDFMDNLTFKPFPSVGQVHPSVNALQGVIQEHDLDRDAIEHITVRLPEKAKQKAGWEYEPIDIMSAQSNIQYALAAYLLDGRLTVDDYTEDAIRRPEVLERIDEIDLMVDESLIEGVETYNARYRTVLEAETADGSTYSHRTHVPRGFPDNPMSEEELLGKFRHQAGKVLDESDIEGIVDFVLHMEDKDDVTDLFSYLG